MLMEKKLYTVIVYSENIAGMLNQVTAEFTRRQMNIETLNVSSSNVEGVHRYTISLWTTEWLIQRVTKRLERRWTYCVPTISPTTRYLCRRLRSISCPPPIARKQADI